MSPESTPDLPPPKSSLIWRTLNRWMPRIMVVWLLGTVAIEASIPALMPPKYRAASVLRVEPPLSSGCVFGGSSCETLDAFLQTNLDRLQSPEVLKAATSRPEVATLARFRNANEPLEALRQAVQVEVLPGTLLIEVSMISKDPTETPIIVNAVVESYLTILAEQENRLVRNQIQRLEEMLRLLEPESDELEKSWKESVDEDDLKAIMQWRERIQKGRETIRISKLDQARRDLLDITLEIAEMHALLDTAKDPAQRTISTKARQTIQELVEQWFVLKFKSDSEAMKYVEEIQLAEARLENWGGPAANRGDPNVQVILNRLDSLKTRYAKLRETKTGTWSEAIEPGVSGNFHGEPVVRSFTREVERLQAKRTELKKLLSELEVGVWTGPSWTRFFDQRESLKAMQFQIQQRLEQLRSQCRSEFRIKKVNAAVTPTRPIPGGRPILMTIGPFAVLMAAFGFFLVVEATTGSKSRPELPDVNLPDSC